MAPYKLSYYYYYYYCCWLRLIALCYSVSGQLTWRDLQHITVLTAHQANLEADDWVTNGAGRLGIWFIPVLTLIGSVTLYLNITLSDLYQAQ